MGVSKNRKAALEKVDKEKQYSLDEASQLVKDITFTKFPASVDLDVKLGVDPRKADQMVRGSVTLPHGTGKEVSVLVLTTEDKQEQAKSAGADYVGLDDYIEKINNGWTDVDVIICTPNVMAKVGRLGRILGPRGLMPNPKSGTVTQDLEKAITEVKAGKIEFKVDKYGIIHVAIGKSTFEAKKIEENARELLNTLIRMKPLAAKGAYLHSISMSSTMSPGIKIDKTAFTKKLQS